MTTFKNVDVALSMWSIFMQMIIQIPLLIMFLAAWFSSRRKIFLTWTIAWIINILALIQIYIVSLTYTNSSFIFQKSFYSLYGSGKILFAIILLFSSIQFSKKDRIIKIPYLYLFLVFIFLSTFFLILPHPVVIQFIVYGSLFLLLFGGAVISLKVGRSIEYKIVALGFFIHSFMYFHHFTILVSWFTNKKVPVYMSRISFFDLISEFVLALSFFLGVVIQIIRELKKANLKLEKNQEHLRNLVDIDPLTGLKNRRVLRKFFEQIKGKCGCVAFIDVNKFKNVNDNLGHSIGDKCLVTIASKLKSIFRPEDGLFRIGGDEFLVVCPEINEMEMKKRLTDLKKVLFHSIKGIKLTIACGVENFNERSHIDEVLKSADRKMYLNKKINGNIFSPFKL